MRKTHALALALVAALAGTAAGDGLVLNDGRKLVGTVKEKPDGFEITVEGQVLSFSKDDVARWVKSPKDMLGGIDLLIDEAKKIYLEAVEMKDGKAADKRFREALPKVMQSRDAYVDAREMFPDGYPELDKQLVEIMKLARLVRERIGASTGEESPVLVIKAPPPALLPPEPAAGARAVGITAAIAVLMDPAKRADAAQRIAARATFVEASRQQGPLADLGAAAAILLARDDRAWRLREDVVNAVGPGVDETWRGRLVKDSDAVSRLVMGSKSVRLRKAADATYVTPPGGAEFKSTRVKVEPDQPSETARAVEEFFDHVGAKGLEELPEGKVASGTRLLAIKAREFTAKDKDAAVAPLWLLLSGVASSHLGKTGGHVSPDLAEVFKFLGIEKSTLGTTWGRREALAMDDFRKWAASGDFGLGVVQFRNDYKAVADPVVRYAEGLLLLFRSIGSNREYIRAATFFEAQSRASTETGEREHFLALAKSIRAAAPCTGCGGTGKVNCSVCKGKGKGNFACGRCKGTGKLIGFKGDVACTGCEGQGKLMNAACPNCKATGKADCKARGCKETARRPTFESFVEAVACAACGGKGMPLRHVASPCPECFGLGMFIKPKSDPTKTLR